MENISIADPKHMPTVVEAVHDGWFSVNDIEFDRASSSLSVKYESESHEDAKENGRFLFLKTIIVPVHEYILKVFNVTRYLVLDKDKGGYYEINEIKYNPATNHITITSDMNISIEIDVLALKIEIEKTKKIIKQHRHLAMFYPSGQSKATHKVN